MQVCCMEGVPWWRRKRGGWQEASQTHLPATLLPERVDQNSNLRQKTKRPRERSGRHNVDEEEGAR